MSERRNVLARAGSFLENGEYKHMEHCQRLWAGLIHTTDEDCSCGLYDLGLIYEAVRVRGWPLEEPKQ